MTTFTRMEIAIAYAMMHTEVGSILHMEPLKDDHDTRVNLDMYTDGMCMAPAMKDYVEKVKAGGAPFGFSLFVVSDRGYKDWAGDLHVFKWADTPDATWGFFVAYSA